MFSQGVRNYRKNNDSLSTNMINNLFSLDIRCRTEGTEGRVEHMSSVIVKENETLDSALRRFKRSCAKAGIQQEIRKREHYEKPSVKRKKKSEAARKRKYN